MQREFLYMKNMRMGSFSAKEKESARSYPTCPLTLPCEFLLNSISEDSFVTIFDAAKESFIQLKNT